MKKKRQQTRNLIILAIVTVGIVLGMWAMNSNLSSDSKAAGKTCLSGIFIKGADAKCYEVMAVQCGLKCCNRQVANIKCRDSKYKYIKGQDPLGQGEEKYGLKCEGTEYDWFGESPNEECFLKRGRVCGSAEQPYCCSKKVPNEFCP